jgi:hypothetical protein
MTQEDYKAAAEVLRSVTWTLKLPKGHKMTPEYAGAEKLVRIHWYTAREIREKANERHVAVVCQQLGLPVSLSLAGLYGPAIALEVARYRFPELPEGSFFRPGIPELIEQRGADSFLRPMSINIT